MEKKEQEVTARNAEIHRQKVGNIEGFVMAGNDGEGSAVASDNVEGWFMSLSHVPETLSNFLLLPLSSYFSWISNLQASNIEWKIDLLYI